MILPNQPFPESFLHFVWKGMYFRNQSLSTICEQPVHIFQLGMLNLNQGPDFLNAHIKIGDLSWWGNIEIHLHTEDWYRHRHHLDPHYDNTVLHVVYESSGKSVVRSDGTEIPELCLGPYIPTGIFQQYEELRLSQSSIPCSDLVEGVPKLILNNWIDRMALERIEAKAQRMQFRLESLSGDWEQVLWEFLAGMMGGPVNKEAFLHLAERIPFKLLKRYANSLIAMEALCMGFAGWLTKSPPTDSDKPDHPDHYYHVLGSEWKFLKRKHKLPASSAVPFHLHRMRPAAFPTIRLSQLLQLVHRFPKLMDLCLPENIFQLLHTPLAASSYWDNHYLFFKEKSFKKKFLGQSQKQLLIINVLVPMAWKYTLVHGRTEPEALIEQVLSRLPAENNQILRKFPPVMGKARNAFQSQGQLQLYKHYCLEKKCLECAVGNHLLKQASKGSLNTIKISK